MRSVACHAGTGRRGRLAHEACPPPHLAAQLGEGLLELAQVHLSAALHAAGPAAATEQAAAAAGWWKGGGMCLCGGEVDRQGRQSLAARGKQSSRQLDRRPGRSTGSFQAAGSSASACQADPLKQPQMQQLLARQTGRPTSCGWTQRCLRETSGRRGHQGCRGSRRGWRRRCAPSCRGCSAARLQWGAAVRGTEKEREESERKIDG
jgi:hypothetical protein